MEKRLLLAALICGAVTTICGCANPSGGISLGTIKGEMFQLSGGTSMPFEIERSGGSGGLWATNPRTGEKLTGKYTVGETDGGYSTFTVRTPGRAGATSTGTVFTPPSNANAQGYMRGDMGTIVQVFINIRPGLIPSGTGQGIDNNGTRYQIQF